MTIRHTSRFRKGVLVSPTAWKGAPPSDRASRHAPERLCLADGPRSPGAQTWATPSSRSPGTHFRHALPLPRRIRGSRIRPGCAPTLPYLPPRGSPILGHRGVDGPSNPRRPLPRRPGLPGLPLLPLPLDLPARRRGAAPTHHPSRHHRTAQITQDAQAQIQIQGTLWAVPGRPSPRRLLRGSILAGSRCPQP
jgi:hypothetical protein